MNMQYLKYLVAIEQYGSITKAAEKLFVSQPYLSKVVRETEDEYHIVIFTRGKNGITLTDNGRIFIDTARQLLENIDQFNRLFKTELADIRRLSISCATSSYAMDAYLQLLKRHPGDRLRFYYRETTNNEVIDDVYSSTADIGVIIASEDNWKMLENLLKARRIAHHRVLNMDTHLIVRVGHPLTKKKGAITLNDVCRYNFVMYAHQNVLGIKSIENVYSEGSMEHILDWSRIRQISYVYSRASLHNLLTQTDAIALGSRETREQNRQFGIVSIPFPYPKHGPEPKPLSCLCYIHQKEKKLSPAAAEYAKILVSTYGGDAGDRHG